MGKNTRMFGIMFEVSLLVASLKISTFMNKPLFIHTSEKLYFMWLDMPSLIQKHAHVKGQITNHHIFKFQPNPSWAKKRPNRYTSFCAQLPPTFWANQCPFYNYRSVTNSLYIGNGFVSDLKHICSWLLEMGRSTYMYPSNDEMGLNSRKPCVIGYSSILSDHLNRLARVLKMRKRG